MSTSCLSMFVCVCKLTYVIRPKINGLTGHFFRICQLICVENLICAPSDEPLYFPYHLPYLGRIGICFHFPSHSKHTTAHIHTVHSNPNPYWEKSLLSRCKQTNKHTELIVRIILHIFGNCKINDSPSFGCWLKMCMTVYGWERWSQSSIEFLWLNFTISQLVFPQGTIFVIYQFFTHLQMMLIYQN